MNPEERAAAVRARLGAAPRFGARIAWPDETGSTNDDCHADGQPGFAALAERQTAGRGQRGRTWAAPPGLGVLLSVVVPLADFADDAFLAAFAAVGVADALAALAGLQCRCKWPNDLLHEGRTLAGALVDRRGAAVMGVGVNVLQGATDFPAEARWPPTSVRLAGGSVTRIELAAGILAAWDRRWRNAETHGPAEVHAAWRARAWPDRGTNVQATLADGSIRRGELLTLGLDDGAHLAGQPLLPAAALVGVLPAEA